MRRWLPWLGLAACVACAFFFVRAITRHWSALTELDWGGNTVVGVLAALACYVTTHGFAARSWQLELRALGVKRPYRQLARIVLTSQFAKYLPGNVGHHVGRAVMAMRVGVPTSAVLASMVLDTLLVLLAGAAFSIPALPLLLRVLEERGMDARSVSTVLAVTVGVAAIAVLVLPTVRRRLRASWPSDMKSGSAAGNLVQAWLTQGVCFVLGATALYILCVAIGATALAISPQAWLQVIGVYAVAWLLGFVVPGAPAGLGVREVVLLLGLTPVVGASQAISASLALRLVTTIGDGMVFVAAFFGEHADCTQPSA